MPKKKSPKLRTVTAVPQQAPAVTQGNVFATFLQEATSLGNEVMARRALQNEIGAFLAQKGLVDEFEAFRNARKQPPVSG